jgi:hypothetical protein
VDCREERAPRRSANKLHCDWLSAYLPHQGRSRRGVDCRRSGRSERTHRSIGQENDAVIGCSARVHVHGLKLPRRAERGDLSPTTFEMLSPPSRHSLSNDDLTHYRITFRRIACYHCLRLHKRTETHRRRRHLYPQSATPTNPPSTYDRHDGQGRDRKLEMGGKQDEIEGIAKASLVV